MSHLEQNLESPRQVADRLGWPLARIRKLIRAKQVRHVKVGGLYFVPHGAIEGYLAERTVEPDRSDRERE